MSQSHQRLLRGLRAAAEPSRLRLLAVLALGEFTVSELTAILGQSQPRVSRHLKLLSDGGLLERFREQHWVFHRVPSDGDGAELARALLEILDPADPLVIRDRERAIDVLTERTTLIGADAGTAVTAEVADESVRELAATVAADLGDAGFDNVLYAGQAPVEMVGALASRARRVVGLSSARREIQRARGALHGNGHSHCVLQQGDLSSAALPAGSFDVVVLDRLLVHETDRDGLVGEAARVLRPAGRVLILESYEALSAMPGDGHPLATLRNWIVEAGLACERLRPVDTGAMHALLATAAPAPAGKIA